MNNLAKEINSLLLENESVKEFLELKKEIDMDEKINELKKELDVLRKKICKNKQDDSSEYYSLLDIYNSNLKIRRYNQLKKDIQDYLVEICDILSLK